MAKLTDTEIFNKIQAFDDFKAKAEPILALIPEIKEKQDNMITAAAISEATEEQRYEKIAKSAVANFQKSGWYRLKQIGILLLVVAAVVLVVMQSIDSSGKVDYQKLIETIKEIAK